MYQYQAQYAELLNREVHAFVNNKDMASYKLQESPNVAYNDLQELNSLFDIESVVGSKRSFSEMALGEPDNDIKELRCDEYI